MENVYNAIVDALRAEGFEGDIRGDEASLEEASKDESIFSVTPALVIAPKTVEDVQIAVRVINEHAANHSELSLTPRAAASGLSGGSLNDSIIIDVMKYLTHVGELTHYDGFSAIELGPGVWFRDIEKSLKEQGHYIPVYPASKDLCAIGGMIGNNCAGAESFTYGHFAEWVESVDMVFADGNVYTLKKWNWDEVQAVMAHDNELGRITREVLALIEAHEQEFDEAKPHTKKNTAGYPLWDVISTNVAEFKQGNGVFDLTRLISGSQGTLGVITNAAIRTLPVPEPYNLLVVPVFDLQQVGNVIVSLVDENPFTIELYDDKTLDLALKNPSFFKDRLSDEMYPHVLDALYQVYFNNFNKTTPAFTILASFTHDVPVDRIEGIAAGIRESCSCDARFIGDPIEIEMFWQIRRAAYTLSKLQDTSKRPAAFLEDMIVPPKNLPAFFEEIKALFEKHEVEAAVHGHGGNGHLHFYPLLDFTKEETAQKVLTMADEFFAVAIQHDGGICGEHNDGIIRTPYLNLMYKESIIGYFREMEAIFDPRDIFNPGKKVHAKFDMKQAMRNVN